MPREQILSSQQVHRTVTRLAYEVLERNRGATSLEVFGIKRRGVALSRLIASVMKEAENLEIALHELDVRPFRDDIDPVDRVLPDEAPRIHIAKRDVILVDDVLYTGRTIRAGIEAVLQYGRPATIQLAVLVDRGHREYPIRPDYVGRVLPTKYQERVEVQIEPELGVFLSE
ncbi:bifunctional pyr operon transcriptional regulator/uracil phosphoribosyltransferase PyrR [soil metagenome]